MVKVDLITGFLGSGKTTFIRKYAKYLMDNGKDIGILENDYGAVNVDMMLLQDLMGENCELEMISGGCDKDCHRRRFKTKLIAMGMCGYDRVIVEPSGIFDIDEFFDILHEEPLNRWYEIGNVIAIVDSRLEKNLSEQADFILASEVADAGCIVISKCQEASAEEIQETLDHINRALENVHCARKFALREDILKSTASEEACMESSKQTVEKTGKVFHKNWEEMSKEDFEQVASCGFEMTSYRKPEYEAEEAFTSLYFMNVKMTEKELREAAEKILSDPVCGHVFRMKGFIMQTEENSQKWLELNATKNEITIRPIAAGQEVLIVIGEGLQEDAIKKYLQI